MNQLTGESTWSLGVLVWLPIFTVIVTALGLAARWVWVRRHAPNSEFSPGEAKFVTLSTLGLALLFVLGTAAGMYPYDTEYHKWHVVHGTVTQVDKRLIADGKAMSERYVVEVAGRSFGIDDTRAATLREGDTVTLSCKREWQYAAESGWACRWLGNAR